MSTNSSIAVVQKNGEVKQIYSHWDGYLSNNGRILLSSYNSFEKANELVKLGNISSLGENIKPLSDLPEKHSFEKPHKNVTVAYHRDRGRGENKVINRYPNLSEYKENGEFQGYEYLFFEGQWFVSVDDGRTFAEMTQEMIDKAE